MVSGRESFSVDVKTVLLDAGGRIVFVAEKAMSGEEFVWIPYIDSEPMFFRSIFRLAEASKRRSFMALGLTQIAV